MNLLVTVFLVFAFSHQVLADVFVQNGIETYYEYKDKKADKNVVFIHDSYFSSWTWKIYSSVIARKGHNTLVYDLYGMGQSSHLKVSGYSRGLLLRQLDALIKEKRWDKSAKPIYVVGSGIGASLAVMYANQNSSVAKVVLLSPAYNNYASAGVFGQYALDFVRDNPNDEIVRLIVKGKVKKEAGRFLGRIPQNLRPTVKRSMSNEISRGGYITALIRRLNGNLYFSYANEYKQLGKKKVPVLLFSGGKDKNLSLGQVKSIRSVIKDLTEVRYANYGTEFSVVEGKKVREKILKFFNQ